VIAHRRRRLPQIGAIVADEAPTAVDRRVLSRSAPLDERPATVSTPGRGPIPAARQPSALAIDPVKKTPN
jgi:hypothetical protein